MPNYPLALKWITFCAGNVKVCGSHVEHQGFLFKLWRVTNYTIQVKNNEKFVFTLLQSKGGIHLIDQKKYPLESYQIHLIFPGQSSSFSCMEETTAYQFKLSRQNFEKLCLCLPINMKLLMHHPIIDITEYQFEILRNDLQQIGSELSRIQPLFPLLGNRASISLQEISRILMDRIGYPQSSSLSVTLNKFLELIELHYKEQHDVAYYADALNMTENALRKLTKYHMSVAPLKLIHLRLLREAKSLLRAAPNPIKATMIELGFQDLSTFSHFFKKRTKMSPSAYQQKYFPPKNS